MTDIDLTEAVEATARDLWTRATHQGIDRERHPEHHAGARAEAEKAWDEDGLTSSEKHYWRQIVLPIVTAAHRLIAKQAWQQGHDTAREYVVEMTLSGQDAHVILGPSASNPYEEARP